MGIEIVGELYVWTGMALVGYGDHAILEFSVLRRVELEYCLVETLRGF